jgi:peptidoglycan hydrolase-like protein with peptidoglycan-binding domain
LTSADSRLNQLDPKITEEEARFKVIKDRLAAFDVPSNKIVRETDLTANDWIAIQTRLIADKHLVGEADGKPGKKTMAAIRAYQAKQNTDVTGHLSPAQIAALLKLADKKP